jgi:hypothetical protein
MGSDERLQTSRWRDFESETRICRGKAKKETCSERETVDWLIKVGRPITTRKDEE